MSVLFRGFYLTDGLFVRLIVENSSMISRFLFLINQFVYFDTIMLLFEIFPDEEIRSKCLLSNKTLNVLLSSAFLN